MEGASHGCGVSLSARCRPHGPSPPKGAGKVRGSQSRKQVHNCDISGLGNIIIRRMSELIRGTSRDDFKLEQLKCRGSVKKTLQIHLEHPPSVSGRWGEGGVECFMGTRTQLRRFTCGPSGLFIPALLGVQERERERCR